MWGGAISTKLWSTSAARQAQVWQTLGWLRQHVHPVGRALNAEDLVRQVTGRPLDSTAFLQHVRGKVQALQPA